MLLRLQEELHPVLLRLLLHLIVSSLVLVPPLELQVFLYSPLLAFIFAVSRALLV